MSTDEFDHPHLMYGQLHATLAAVLALIDTLPPAAAAAFAGNLAPAAQRVRDVFSDQPFEEVYFEGFDEMTERFRERALDTASTPPSP